MMISFASTVGFIITSLELLAISNICVPPDENLKLLPAASNVISAAASIVKLLALIVISVPSPSIFSLSPPNTIPTLFGMCTSEVAVRLIFAPEVIVKSVLSPSIFSPVPKVKPMFAGITTSATAVKLILLPAIVKSVPSPSIFSPSSPNVKPTFEGMLISVVAVKFISLPELNVKSVPSEDIFSPPLSKK